LGDDVEPCFEGASVTAPDVSTKFTLDDNFKHTLYSMMQDLKNALNGGGQQMDNLEQSVTTEATEEKGVETNFTQEEAANVVPEEEAKDTSVSSSYVKEDEKED